MFIDEITILVASGKGGDGCVSFRREKYVPRGGPDGGDGGDGGDIFLVGSTDVSTLLELSQNPEYRAEHGRPGQGRSSTGSSAEALRIVVPLGTQVFRIGVDRPGSAWLEILTAGQEVLVARGGRGGRGNRCFATSTHQAPRECEEGQPGETRELKLVLKLVADVGLVGLPNAGKSTLLARLSRATPKIADYPFTTLAPSLGVVGAPDGTSFVMADLPGLIEGAHLGVGLGDRFLRHVERTRLLLHLVDPLPLDGGDPVTQYDVIVNELSAYSPVLADKPRLVVLTKADAAAPEALADVSARLAARCGQRPLAISAVSGAGLDRLLPRLRQALAGIRA